MRRCREDKAARILKIISYRIYYINNANIILNVYIYINMCILNMPAPSLFKDNVFKGASGHDIKRLFSQYFHCRIVRTGKGGGGFEGHGSDSQINGG